MTKKTGEHFDIAIVGGGPSGYAAAMRALDFGKRVVVIEKNHLGGAGAINGALSSKTWWALSREAATLRAGLERYGLPAYTPSMAAVRIEVDRAMAERLDLMQAQMSALMQGGHGHLLSYRQGQARVLAPGRIELTSAEGLSLIVADNIILATGSRPRHLPGILVDETHILSSDGIEHLQEFPASLVIVDAGVIGCEYATIFSGFGRTRVFLIDKGERILPSEDANVVAEVEHNLEANGVHIHRNSRLVSMRVEDGGVRYELEFVDGERRSFLVEKGLVAVGRVAATEGLWAEDVDIETGASGIVASSTATSVPGIYAVGDLTADIALVNVGELEGRHAVELICGAQPEPLIYENISTIMFLHPEVAGVGINETRATELGIPYRVATLAYTAIPGAIVTRRVRGFINLLVTDDEHLRILGMRVVGHQASSTIQAVALLISMKKGISELAECVHPHPSISEGIQECVRALLGKSILKPQVTGGQIQCRTVRPQVRSR